MNRETVLRGLKRLVEKTTREQIFVATAAPLAEVAELVRRLRPVRGQAPLVRFGGPRDGGYLMPDDLDGIRASISPGVCDEVAFDLEIANRGIDVHMMDASVDEPPVAHERFHFQKKFLDLTDGPATIRLDTLCESLRPTTDDLLLQMDIEGAEYRVLLDTSEHTLKRFRIMVIEFHDLVELYSKFGLQLMGAVFDKLLRTHVIVHAHPNNAVHVETRGEIEIPRVMELTFHRRDRVVLDPSRPVELPHPLDADNIDAPTIRLGDCWRG